MAVSLQGYRDLFTLAGKTALVAGGGGGIGRAVCEGLASLGANVRVLDKAFDRAQAVAGAINEAGGEAGAVDVDALNIPDFRAFVESMGKSDGNIHVFVNCVGTHYDAPAEEFSEERWDTIINVNLKSAFFMTQAVAAVQMKAGSGRQIHITSVRSLLGIQNRGYVAYCASKGGMAIMIKQLAVEWAKHGITVNGIAPTFTRTELVTEYLEDPAFYEPLVRRIPVGRICEPEDIAGLAMYLASPAAAFVTGQNIFIDGGVTATQ